MDKYEIDLQRADAELVEDMDAGAGEFAFELLEARTMLLASEIGICTSTSTSCDCTSSSSSCC
jgi:tRNA G37 N-methylase Trm5